ncbi:MAG: GNAT family N-acetyltransferase [Bacteroidales bacterium]|nr:GNAT family N-acetyltransferase [Bacteroidales bacterium]
MEIAYRLIAPNDNIPLATLIRSVFREFEIDQPGTVYTDPTTDHLFELFSIPKSIYWVAEDSGTIIGGCGIYPTDGLPEGCAELVKLYLLPEARGKGIGLTLMQKSITAAITFGFTQLYLESLPELGKAVSMYEKAGFRHIGEPLGNSGHFACNIRMIKDLRQ